MIVVLSGEGPSDLGQCTNQQGRCSPPEFAYGPMTVLVDQIIESELNYSPLQTTSDCYVFYSEQALELAEQARKHEKRTVSLTGKKRPEQETGYFHINAWILGQLAHRIEAERGDKSIAILFRDCDGTHSAKAGLYDAKWNSMISGFARANYTRGVPMLPKPKSEAWLLCAAKMQPYQHCATLETLPGNDASPNSAKKQLDKALNEQTTAPQLSNWLKDHPYDHQRAAQQLPSFASFLARLKEAIAALNAQV